MSYEIDSPYHKPGAYGRLAEAVTVVRPVIRAVQEGKLAPSALEDVLAMLRAALPE